MPLHEKAVERLKPVLISRPSRMNMAHCLTRQNTRAAAGTSPTDDTDLDLGPGQTE